VVEPATYPGASDLGALGFDVERVVEERAALALAAEQPFHAVVVDVNETEMRGLSFVSRLRDVAPGVAVVFLTAKYTNELAARASELGVFQTLERPADVHTLERVVHAAVSQAQHVLTTFRAIMHSPNPPRSVPATDAKNEFGSMLDAAVQDGAVIITKHDVPRAVLVSVERMGAFLAKHEPDLKALTREFDAIVARMHTPKARAAARDLFTATPEELGKAALAGVKRQDG
jgi:prevent-host-death family protein